MNATPAAAKLAKELGVEIDGIKGTGKDGKATVKDVRAAEADAPGVVAAVKRELAGFKLETRRSAAAASALELAKQLDDKRNSATSKSMCAKALNETMDKLQALQPPKKEEDGVDDLKTRREARRKRASAPKRVRGS